MRRRSRGLALALSVFLALPQLAPAQVLAAEETLTPVERVTKRVERTVGADASDGGASAKADGEGSGIAEPSLLERSEEEASTTTAGNAATSSGDDQADLVLAVGASEESIFAAGSEEAREARPLNLAPLTAGENECGTNLTWSWDAGTGTLTLTGSGDMYDYTSYSAVPWASNQTSIQHVVMPEAVTSIGKYAFYGLTVAEGEFPIPAGTTTIGDYAFYNSTFQASELTLPSSLTALGDNAFYGCSGLQAVSVPRSVDKIGSGAFQGCANLVRVTLSDGVETIDANAFRECTRLTSLDYTGSVESIGDYAFYGCTSLKNLSVPEGVGSIGYLAFGGCTSLQGDLVLPASLTSLGERAFEGCTGYSGNLVIRSGLMVINYNTFYQCGFRSITLPATLRQVYKYAFDQHQAKQIVIPPLVTSIGEGAFRGENLKSIYFRGNAPSLYSADYYGSFGPASGRTLYYIEDRTYWDRSTYFGYDCAQVAEAEIPADGNADEALPPMTPASGECGTNLTYTVTGTGAGRTLAFSGSGDMYDYTAEDAVPWKAYRDTILHVSVPEGVTSIGKYAFYGLPVVQGDFPIPSTVTSIGNYAFYQADFKADSLMLPASLDYLGESAFYNCRGIKGVSIPGATYKIGASAFYKCMGLESITLAEGVETIDANAFRECSNLKSLDYTGSVESIGDYAFYGCTSLKNLSVPEGVGSIGYLAFGGCTSLQGDLVLPASLTSLGERVFEGCTGYSGNLVIRSGLMVINYNTFYQCGFRSITLPATLRQVYKYAFDQHQAKQIVIPALVTSIGEAAFRGENLKSIYFRGNAPTSLNEAGSYGSFGPASGKTLYYISTKAGWSDTLNGYTCAAISESEFPAEPEAPTVAVTGVSLDKTEATLAIGDTLTLRATVAPAGATNKTVAWSSSAPDVALVNQSGKITALAVGTATITVTTADGAKTATCAVTVSETAQTPVPVTGLTLDKTEAEVAVGKTITLTATLTPANATDKTVTWRSSNPAVATVDDAGVVTGVAKGKTVIIASDASGGFTETCTVTVVDAGTDATKLRVTFDVNGGGALDASVSSKEVSVGAPYGTLPVPTREGYHFLGWFTGREGGRQVTAETVVTETAAHSLYAQWIEGAAEAKRVTLTLDTNGGPALDAASSTRQVTVGAAYGILPVPAYEGHTFAGWYTDRTAGVLVTETSTVTAETDHVLYAHWTEGGGKEVPTEWYTVLFYAEDAKVGEELVEAGETVTNLPEMDETFIGWYDDVTDKLWDSTMPVMRSMRLYARFKAVEVPEQAESSGRDPGLKVVTVSEEEHVYMVKGQSYAFEARDSAGKAIVWQTSDKSIIKISSKYKAKAVGTTKTSIAMDGDTGVYVYNGSSETDYVKRYTVHVIDPYLTYVTGGGDTAKTERVSKALTVMTGTSQELRLAANGPEGWQGDYDVSWTTSNEEIAKVDDGKVYTLAKGTAKITAYINGKALAATIKVVDVVNPGKLENEADVTLAPLQSVSVKFTDSTFKVKNLIWDNEAHAMAVSEKSNGKVDFYQDDVVRVTPAGKLTAVGVGTTTLTATSGNATKTFTVTVNKPVSTILYMNKGKTKSLKFYNVKQAKVNWKLADPSMVDVVGDMDKGKAKGKEAGIARVSGVYAPYSYESGGRTWGAGITYTATIYVEEPRLVSGGTVTDLNNAKTSGKLSLTRGDTAVILTDGIYQPVVFTSAKPTVAFVDEAGVVSARSAGKATLTARVNGKKLTVAVTIK